MTELERLVLQYFNDLLPEDVSVIKKQQWRDAYGDFHWQDVGRNDCTPIPRPQLPEGAWEEEITIHSVQTPDGIIRAGYGPESKTLVIVDVVEL